MEKVSQKVYLLAHQNGTHKVKYCNTPKRAFTYPFGSRLERSPNARLRHVQLG